MGAPVSVDISSSIKLPILTTSNGEIPFGSPFLDVASKFNITANSNLTQGTSFKIFTLIVSDGLSFGNLKMADIRNYLTRKGIGKISTKKHRNHTKHIAEEAAHTAIYGIGLGVLIYLIKTLKASKHLFPGHPDDVSVFKANLKQAGTMIGELKTIAKKWNSMKQLPKGTDGMIEQECFTGMPAVLIESILKLNNFSGRLHFRNNIPLNGLRRDHARKVKLTIASKVLENLGDGEQAIAKQTDIINLGKIKYVTLEEFSQS